MKPGFILFDLILAVFLGGFLMVCCATVLTKLQQTINYIGSSTTHLMEIYNAIEYLTNDLAGAPGSIQGWKKRSQNTLVWTVDEDYGYQVEKGKLIRRRGTYFRETDTWNLKSSDTVLSSVEAFDVSFNNVQAFPVLIDIHLVAYGKPYVFSVRCLNNFVLPA